MEYFFLFEPLFLFWKCLLEPIEPCVQRHPGHLLTPFPLEFKHLQTRIGPVKPEKILDPLPWRSAVHFDESTKPTKVYLLFTQTGQSKSAIFTQRSLPAISAVYEAQQISQTNGILYLVVNMCTQCPFGTLHASKNIGTHVTHWTMFSQETQAGPQYLWIQDIHDTDILAAGSKSPVLWMDLAGLLNALYSCSSVPVTNYPSTS